MIHSPLVTLCTRIGLTATCTLIAYEQELDKPKDKRWPHFAWSVLLTLGERSHRIPYRCGIGHIHPMPKTFMPHEHESRRKAGWLLHPKAPCPPSPANVLASLLSDAQSGADTFDSFCSDLGYDTDSRSALETYLQCQRSGTELRRLLGEHYTAACEAAQEH